MKLLVIGDSHANVFYRDLFKQRYPQISWDIFTVPGATISGLRNPNAKTQAKRQFIERLGSEFWDRIIVQIGEVDVGFVIWYRANKHNVPVQKMADKVLSGYEYFMDLLLKHCSQLHTLSIPLPTISDDNNWGEVANLRNSIDVLQKDRTRMTLQINSGIARICARKSVDHIALDTLSLGQNGLVSIDLLRTDKTDHHYDYDIYAAMIVNCLEDSFLSYPLQ